MPGQVLDGLVERDVVSGQVMDRVANAAPSMWYRHKNDRHRFCSQQILDPNAPLLPYRDIRRDPAKILL